MNITHGPNLFFVVVSLYVLIALVIGKITTYLLRKFGQLSYYESQLVRVSLNIGILVTVEFYLIYSVFSRVHERTTFLILFFVIGLLGAVHVIYLFNMPHYVDNSYGSRSNPEIIPNGSGIYQKLYAISLGHMSDARQSKFYVKVGSQMLECITNASKASALALPIIIYDDAVNLNFTHWYSYKFVDCSFVLRKVDD